MKKAFRDEFAAADLGDARRSHRLVELGLALGAFPGASFPEALGDGAALEAAYRFLGNGDVEAADVLEPHFRETAGRCGEEQIVVVAHDTTDFTFPGKARRGLGRIRGSVERGFLAHTSLAVSLNEWRVPLGVLHLETWTRATTPKKPGKKSPRERQRDADRESLRWLRGVQAVESRSPGLQPIHVMDREADAYDLLAELTRQRHRFIIRSTFDRRVADDELLSDAVAVPPIRLKREVAISERKRDASAKARKIHPPRAPRVATLGIKAVQVELLRPRDLVGDLPERLRVNVVVVEEVDAPSGESPVVWRLYTSEPIGTRRDLERVVDGYRCRWRAEEFFKALKTGCAIERRQLETYHALVNALALYIPIAWRMLRHRTLAAVAGEDPATKLLTPMQIRLLRKLSKQPLPRQLTIQNALIAIAALGGHLARNGDPGWITLARGYERLLTLEEGALLGAEM